MVYYSLHVRRTQKPSLPFLTLIKLDYFQLGGVIVPNDGLCHVKDQEYTASTLLVSPLSWKIQESPRDPYLCVMTVEWIAEQSALACIFQVQGRLLPAPILPPN